MIINYFLAGILLFSMQVYAFSENDFTDDIKTCGAKVNADTLKALIKTESKWHPYAVADAGPLGMPWQQRKLLVKSYYPVTKNDAIELVNRLISNRHSVSMGLTQINDGNLNMLKLSVEDLFEPCKNISAGAKILSTYYVQALKKYPDRKVALDAALSKYNSGDWERGAKEGYVDLIYKHAGNNSNTSNSNKRHSSLNKINAHSLTMGSIRIE